MPETLRRYIYNPDHGERKSIPPLYAMKEVFGPVKFAKDLDIVKKMFPDEPLFAKLTSTPNKKSREGLSGMINLLREDSEYKNKTLFKNGEDDLGLYILKKIYLEGKTLKEINKDFEKDVSVHFKSYEIKPQDYYAYGIKYPEASFWNSFYVNRDDYEFNRKYLSKRAASSGMRGSSIPVHSVPSKTTQKNKFKDVADWELQKLSDALIQGNGSRQETERQIKKRNVKNKEVMNFVAQYMGEINSVVLEKLHISDDMRDYFENYDGLSKKQKDKFNEYMKNPFINDLRSKVMISTIRFFMDIYGADGDNEDFKELLEYAHNIKPKRIERDKEHERLQNEYEAALGIFENNEQVSKEHVSETKAELSYEQIILNEAKKNNAKIYNFKLSNGAEISIVANLQELLTQKLNAEFANMPPSYRNKFIKFVANHPKATEDYLLSLFYGKDNYTESLDIMKVRENDSEDEMSKEEITKEMENILMSKKERDKITFQILEDFGAKNKRLIQMSQQALMELIPTIPMPDETMIKVVIEDKYNEQKAIGAIPEDASLEDKQYVMSTTFNEVIKDFTNIKKCNVLSINPINLSRKLAILQFKPLTPEQHKFLEDRIQQYRAPLSSKEIKKISLKLCNEIFAYDITKAEFNDEYVEALFKTAIEAGKRYPEAKIALNDIIEKIIITPENTAFRYLIEKNADKNIVNARVCDVIKNLLFNQTEYFKLMASIDKDIMDRYCMPVSPELYNILMHYRSMKAMFYITNEYIKK